MATKVDYINVKEIPGILHDGNFVKIPRISFTISSSSTTNVNHILYGNRTLLCGKFRMLKQLSINKNISMCLDMHLICVTSLSLALWEFVDNLQ